ncbi:chemotaxis protein [Halalkalibacter sp. APA_J-10(15)]|uniref:chemotaxis protein n=1 Tax=unclassified Halalkalibacter TaxID=2893063 RepID=UPI001FF4E769|nr:chemotaxis protein [Halalkalibacter sp. APA_J-10(15)]MCK0472067.1 chemotaxis protein [Halalkalibacter sp. APA_J-10(15)]
MAESKKGILLETGTNELEVIVFEVGTSLFGINVMKVREIIPAQTITPIPNSHRHIEGIIRLREEVMTVVNLTDVLGFEPSNNLNDDKFIIAELNQLKVAFRVQDVSRIHRISWEDIQKPNELAQNIETAATGVIKIEDEMILLVDFEKILVDINPERSISVQQVKQLGERERSNKKIIVAEDSAILRKLIGDTLKEAGYDQVQFFEDGQALWEFLYGKKDDESLFDDLQLVITDIEMPKMDGHHLTKRIKEDEKLQQLPVVIFSSLITEDLFYKGKGIGADAQISKPQIVELIKVIDQLVL